MKRLSVLTCSAGFAIAAYGSLASAEETRHEEGYLHHKARAPENAFEIGLGGGYTQGFGGIDTGLKVQDLSHAGFAPELTLGWRATPGVMVGISGQYQEFKADNDLARGTNTRGFSAGIDAQFHGAPYVALDPWVGIGAGYRALYLTPDGADNNSTLTGFQLAKVRVGADVRVSDSVALGPVIGADLNMFVWRNPEGATGNIELANKRLNTFVFAGLQGRFDLGGSRVQQTATVAKR